MNKKFKKVNIDSLTSDDILALGRSLLDGINGEVADLDNGGKQPEMKLHGDYREDAIMGCTMRREVGEHIDIFSPNVEITYDMGKEYYVSKAVIRSFYFTLFECNYTIGEFKLYTSKNREDLFDDANEVAHEIPRDKWTWGDPNNFEWLYDVDDTFRYYGIKITDANPTDDISRLGYIGLYNDDYTHAAEYLEEKFSQSILVGAEPKLLTDGIIFDDDLAYKLDGEESFTFEVKDYSDITRVWIIATPELNAAIEGFAAPKIEEIEQGRAVYTFESNSVPLKEAKFTVTVSGKGAIDQIGAFSANREVSIDFDTVLCEDFMGVGTDVLPMSFMPEAISKGYNEVYWALESERIKKAKSNVVRLWFQPDWLCDTYEQYKNGDYMFDCQKLQSFYRYLDAFKACGTEVEFDFGWKVASHAQEWFCIDTAKATNSAPKELDLFAKCCAATLKELIVNRGYDNIKYLTFYNEPDYGNYTVNGDFSIGEGIDRRPYWAEMLRLTRIELNKLGLEDKLKYWVCEQSGAVETQRDWIKYFEENCKGLFDVHSFHRYLLRHENAEEFFEGHKAVANGTPIMCTECGQNYGLSGFAWDINECQFFQDIANHGVSGALLWCLNGIDITDPCSFTMRNQIDMWDCPHYPGGIDNVRENYYRWAYLSHYVPNHCKSVKSEVVYGSGENTRVCAFKSGEDYTVVLEINNEVIGDRNIEIKLNKQIGKTFYKHVYRMPCKRDGNATMPPVEKEIFADDVIRDTVTSDYQQVVYTTIAPVTQVEVASNEVFLAEDQKYLLSASVIDGDGEVAYELVAQIGDSACFDVNRTTASFNENAKDGDMFAVKAYSVNKPEATSVIIFKYSSKASKGITLQYHGC